MATVLQTEFAPASPRAATSGTASAATASLRRSTAALKKMRSRAFGTGATTASSTPLTPPPPPSSPPPPPSSPPPSPPATPSRLIPAIASTQRAAVARRSVPPGLCTPSAEAEERLVRWRAMAEMEMSVGMGLAEFGGVMYICDAESCPNSGLGSFSDGSFDSESLEDCRA